MTDEMTAEHRACELPHELLALVLYNLPLPYLPNAAAVSRAWRNAADEPVSWSRRATLLGLQQRLSADAATKRITLKQAYHQMLACDHSRAARRFEWASSRRGTTKATLWLSPSHGSVETHCACERCGRAYVVRLSAHAEGHTGGSSMDFTAVITRAVFTAERGPGSWSEVWHDDYYYS